MPFGGCRPVSGKINRCFRKSWGELPFRQTGAAGFASLHHGRHVFVGSDDLSIGRNFRRSAKTTRSPFISFDRWGYTYSSSRRLHRFLTCVIFTPPRIRELCRFTILEGVNPRDRYQRIHATDKRGRNRRTSPMAEHAVQPSQHRV